MARKLPGVEKTVSPEVRLGELVPRYARNKAIADDYKKKNDADNAEIKEIMLTGGIPSFEAEGYVAKVSTSTRESFDEEALLGKLQSMKELPEGVIKTKEYVDMDALESAIYNGKINAAELASARVVKEVTTLRVSRKKEK